jgi:hypothetical protein
MPVSLANNHQLQKKRILKIWLMSEKKRGRPPKEAPPPGLFRRQQRALAELKGLEAEHRPEPQTLGRGRAQHHLPTPVIDDQPTMPDHQGSPVAGPSYQAPPVTSTNKV